MRPRTAFAALVVAGGATLGAGLAAHVAGWVDAPWVDHSQIPPLEPWTPGGDLRSAFETFPAPGGPQPQLRLLDDNRDAWVERWRLLGATRERVDVASFIVRDDVFGLSFLGYLLRLSREGVQVRLLVDAHGTKMARSPFEDDYLDELVNAGIETRVYRPMTGRIAQALLTLDPIAAIASEHDKLLLVDRRLSLVGGRNIATEYYADPRRAPKSFHDVDVTIEGAATCLALERAFDAEWDSDAAHRIGGDDVNLTSQGEPLLGAFRAMDAWLRDDAAALARLASDEHSATWLEVLAKDHPEMRGALHGPRPPAARAEIRLLDSAPRHPSDHDQVTEGLRRLLASTRDEVLIQSPYLVLSEAAVELLSQAARRGVQITVITNSPSSSDNAVSQAFFMEQWPEILARCPGMRLFVRGDGHNLHGKTAVFDDQVGVVSTYNLDPVSIYVDGEVAVVAWSEEFARRVAEPILDTIASGAPSTYEYRIVRGDEGEPVLDDEGKPVVLFGPSHHTDPEQWKALSAWWRLLRTMEDVGGFDPIF